MSIHLQGGRGGSVFGADSLSQMGSRELGAKNNISEKDEGSTSQFKEFANNCSWATEKEDLYAQP